VTTIGDTVNVPVTVTNCGDLDPYAVSLTCKVNGVDRPRVEFGLYEGESRVTDVPVACTESGTILVECTVSACVLPCWGHDETVAVVTCLDATDIGPTTWGQLKARYQ
jgi:hypothetical protein